MSTQHDVNDPGEPRRIIGDGEHVADGEVEGLSSSDLLELHRAMVLLRTFDERAVVYQRQGRIGTYAIYWGHEAIQAGAHFAFIPVVDRRGGWRVRSAHCENPDPVGQSAKKNGGAGARTRSRPPRGGPGAASA